MFNDVLEIEGKLWDCRKLPNHYSYEGLIMIKHNKEGG
jgi:hypothetical protein